MLKKLRPVAQRLLLRQQRNSISSSSSSSGRVYEPDYLDLLKPKYPQFEGICVQLKGYDFPVLESYQRFLHNVAEYMDLDVSDCYAMPPQHTTVQRLRPNSTTVDAEYKLTLYERNLELNDVDAPTYPLFLRVAQSALPEGVQLNIQEINDELVERRYVPDRDLLDLKAQLERMETGNIAPTSSGFKKK